MLRSQTVLLIFVIAIFCGDTKANPLFFQRPNSIQNQADGESENVSVYTTEKNAPYKRESPNVYEIIAKNVLERITPPVVSHFILVTAKDRNTLGRLRASRTTTESSIGKVGKLEIVEDTKESAIEDTDGSKEPLDPELIKNNPSFTSGKKLDRIVFPTTDSTKSNEISNNDDDDDDDDDDDEDVEEDAEVVETEKMTPKPRTDESAIITILEVFASIGILVQGFFDTIFMRNT